MYEMRWNALIFQKVQRKREIFAKIIYEMRWNALIFQKVQRKTLHNNALKYTLSSYLQYFLIGSEVIEF